MTQDEFRQMKRCYESNYEFHDYVEKYRCKHGLSINEALTYKLIYERWCDNKQWQKS